jgi:hypothetical protein
MAFDINNVLGTLGLGGSGGCDSSTQSAQTTMSGVDTTQIIAQFIADIIQAMKQQG